LSVTPTTVLVTGAGFTKSFYPSAPLVEDDYYITELLDSLRRCSRALPVVEADLARTGGKKLNIERLMTRLDGGMPHDFGYGAQGEMAFAFDQLKQALLRRLQSAENHIANRTDDLKQFAKFCVDNSITCVTFNYDDFLDQALYSVRPYSANEYGEPGWQPDKGYGFYCRDSGSCLIDTITEMHDCRMFLFKLHGSLNWYARLGYSPLCPVEAIVHHSEWYRHGGRPYDRSMVREHLEEGPLVVPPVLAKADLLKQPVLRMVWSGAYHSLLKADLVVFIGYSLPITDLAARFLFSESIRDEADIVVVDLNPEAMNSYRSLFPKLDPETCFHRTDAADWCCKVAEGTIAL